MNVLTCEQVPSTSPPEAPDALASATALGFALHQELVTSPSREAEYREMLSELQYKSMAHLVVLSEMIATKGIDPGASMKNILDAAEFSYKTSGMAAKQTAKEQAAAGAFSIQINLPATPTAPAHTTTIEGHATLVAPAEEPEVSPG